MTELIRSKGKKTPRKRSQPMPASENISNKEKARLAHWEEQGWSQGAKSRRKKSTRKGINRTH